MIDEALFARLSGFAGLSAIVAARIYPIGNVPQNPTKPYVTYQQIDEPREHAMGVDPPIRQPRFQFSAWADDSTSCRDVAAQIDAALSRFSGTQASIVIQDILKESELDLGFDPTAQIYQRALDFVVWHVP